MVADLHYIALVPAAGVGARMQSDRPKQYLLVHGRPILWHTLAALHTDVRIGKVCVVIAPEDPWFDQFDWQGLPKLSVMRCGGDSRAESVRNGLAQLLSDAHTNPWVLVHDAARPCLGSAELARLIDSQTANSLGGLLAVPVPDTVKKASSDQTVQATIPRDVLWLAQTPQMFRLASLYASHQGDLTAVTDEASAMEAAGIAPQLVLGSRNNLKVTFPEDLLVVSALLNK